MVIRFSCSKPIQNYRHGCSRLISDSYGLQCGTIKGLAVWWFTIGMSICALSHITLQHKARWSVVLPAIFVSSFIWQKLVASRLLTGAHLWYQTVSPMGICVRTPKYILGSVYGERLCVSCPAIAVFCSIRKVRSPWFLEYAVITAFDSSTIQTNDALSIYMKLNDRPTGTDKWNHQRQGLNFWWFARPFRESY